MSDGADTDRTRTYSWDDPLELLSRDCRHVRDRGTPPDRRRRAAAAADRKTLGFGPIEVEEGRATFTIEPAEFHYNPIGVVHGGLALALLDSAMGCAVHSTLAAGVAYTTLEVKANFVRPLTSSTGLIRCTGTVVHGGRTVATAEGRVVDADGKLYAHGTSTLLIFGD